MNLEPLIIESRKGKPIIACLCDFWVAIIDIDGSPHCKICAGKIVKLLLDELTRPRQIEYVFHAAHEQRYPVQSDLWSEQ